MKRMYHFLVLLMPLFLLPKAGIADIHEKIENGKNAIRRGESSIALANFRNALEINPSSVQAMTGLAESYQLMNDHRKARSIYEKILEQNPDHREAKTGLARTLILEGDHLKARTILSEVQKEDPGSISNNVAFAQLYASTGNMDLSAAYFRKVLRLEPFHLLALLGLAGVEHTVGNVDEAKELLDRATRIAPNHRLLQKLKVEFATSRALQEDSSLERKEELLDRAVEEHRKFIGMNPDSSEAHIQLAKVLMNRGEFQEAKDHLERSIELANGASQRANGYYLLGVLYQRSGKNQVEQAIQALQESLKIDSHNRFAAFALEDLLIHKRVPEKNSTLLKKHLAAEHVRLMNYNQKIGLQSVSEAHMRRAMELSNLDPELIEQRMERNRIAGDYPGFLNDLMVLAKLKPEDASTQFRLESALKNRFRSLPFREGLVELKPNGIEKKYKKNSYRVFVFDFKNKEPISMYPDGGRILSLALQFHLGMDPMIQVPSRKNYEKIRNKVSLAKNINHDPFTVVYEPEFSNLLETKQTEQPIEYIIQGSYIAGERNVTVFYEVRNRLTDQIVMEFKISESGKQAIDEISRRASKRIQSILTPRGEVVKVSSEGIFVNLGNQDGLKKDDRLLLKTGSGREVELIIKEVSSDLSRAWAQDLNWYEITVHTKVAFQKDAKKKQDP